MSKFVIAMVAMFAVLAATNNINIKENYTTAWGLPNGVKTNLVKVDSKTGAMQSTKGFGNTGLPSGGSGKGMRNLNSHSKGSFVSYPNLKSKLPPRGNGFTNYGANVKYNMPEPKHMAGDFNKMTSTCDLSPVSNLNSCGGGSQKPVDKKTETKKVEEENKMEVVNALPVGDMRSTSVDGRVENVVHYQNFIRANTKSRLRGLANPILGDLPIVPDSCGWFRPSVTPNLDLHPGALSVMAGKNETSHTFNSLVYPSSGGSMTALGGIDISQPSSDGQSGLNQIVGSQGRTAMADIQFSSF